MSLNNIFSHTKEIIGLALPFFTVVLVLSLLSAGVVDNQIPDIANDPTSIPAKTIFVESTQSTSEFAGSRQETEPTPLPEELAGEVVELVTPTPEEVMGRGGILLDEAASTISAELID